MIFTVTINPSIDYIMYVKNFSVGTIMRSENVSYRCGGKGINVSTVLAEFLVPSCALGFVAGTVGTVIENELAANGIMTDFVRLNSGESRINVKLRSELETDINAAGPEISSNDLDELMKKLHHLTNEGDIIVLSGSVPKCLGDGIYADIMKGFEGREVRFVVDAQGALLSEAVVCKPFLIKPNDDELAQLFGKRAENDEEIISQAKKLQKLGAENVLVSRGSKGSLLLTREGDIYIAGGAEGKAVNTVGAGDAMVAGFLAGYISDGNYETALKWGSAAGGATAMSEGLAKREDILRLINN